MTSCELDQVLNHRYRLVRLMTQGGMGQIFEARDTQRANQRVVVKLLHEKILAHDQMRHDLVQRFQVEARVTMLLSNHPNITKVLDYGWDDGQPFIVMEYLGEPPRMGSNLRSMIVRSGPMDPARVVRLAQQMCAGFHYAHCFHQEVGDTIIRGVLHRDIKPSNIFVVQDPCQNPVHETVKILDFGIAQVMSNEVVSLGSQFVSILGTIQYASPEQLTGKEVDPRSDIYSIGIILYEMLAGRLPLHPRTESRGDWVEAHVKQDPIPLGDLSLPHYVPPSLQAVVMACLAKDPQNRPTSMQALGDDLQLASGPLDSIDWVDWVSSVPTQPIPRAEPLSFLRESWDVPTPIDGIDGEADQN